MWPWILIVASCVVALALLLSAMSFTKAENRVMRLLRERGSMTGLELVKSGAASRSQVYLVLDRLCEEGCVRRFSPKDGSRERYVATEFLTMRIKAK